MPHRRPDPPSPFTANRGSLTGVKRHRGQTATTSFWFNIEPGLGEWFRDRAAILDVPVATMFRDILVSYRQLVREAEQDAGISWDVPEGDDSLGEMVVPERHAGYRAQLLPAGHARSHLDGSPLGLEEL